MHECVLTVQALFMAFLCFKIGGFLIERKNEKVKQSARSYNDLRNGKSPCRFCSRRGRVCTEDVCSIWSLVPPVVAIALALITKEVLQLVICRDFSWVECFIPDFPL